MESARRAYYMDGGYSSKWEEKNLRQCVVESQNRAIQAKGGTSLRQISHHKSPALVNLSVVKLFSRMKSVDSLNSDVNSQATKEAKQTMKVYLKSK